MATTRILYDLIARDNASSTFSRVGASAATLEGKMARTGKTMTRVGTGMSKAITLPVLAAGAASVKLAVDFQDSMQKINGLVGISQKQVGAWSKDILAMAKNLPQSPKELADAMFFVTSAGLRGKTALDALRMSAKGAAAGLGDTQTVADVVTSAMNAYGAKVVSASKATDILTATVKEGKASAASLAPVFGRIIPLASTMGVKFSDVGASLAAMTRIGMSANEAATSTQAILSGLLKPSAAGAKALASVGLSYASIREEIKKKGLFPALMEVKGAFHGNTAELAKVIPNVRALRGFLALTGSQAKATSGIFARMQHTTGATDKAFESASKTAKFKFASALSTLQVAAIQVGTKMLPVLSRLAARAVSLIGWFSKLPGPVKEGAKALGLVLVVAGPLLAVTGKMIQLGAVGVKVAKSLKLISAATWLWTAAQKEATGAALGTRIQLAALKVQQIAVAAAQKAAAAGAKLAAAGQWLLNAAMSANPVVLVVAAIVALIAIFVVLWIKCKWFRDFWKALWRDIVQWAKDAWHWIQDAAGAVFNWLKHNWPLVLGILTGPIGLAVVAIARYWGKIMAAGKAAWHFIQSGWNAVWHAVVTVAKWFADRVLNFFGSILHGAAAAFGWIPGLGGQLKAAAAKFDEFHRRVDSALSFKNKTITVPVSFVTAPGGTHGPKPSGGYAAGGMITGGVAGRDSVPGLLMPGELIVPAAMVRGGAVDHLRGQLPGFAAGGLVGGSFSGSGLSLRASVPPVAVVDKAVLAAVNYLAQRNAQQLYSNLGGGAMMNYASQYLGTPYVWGGTTPAGWDCSGFTSWVYHHFGYNIPRTSQQQQLWAKPSRDRPGALVFFYGYGGNAAHVGLSYGNGKMINASSPGVGTVISGTAGNTGFGIPPSWYGRGGTFRAGQLIGVGERGPELIRFGQPGRVYSPEQSAAMTARSIEVRVYVGDREITDIVRTEITAHDRQIARRAGAGAGMLP